MLIGITTSSYDFTSLTPQEKTDYLQRLTLYLDKGVKPTNSYNLSVFFSSITDLLVTILIYISSQSIVRYTDRIKKDFLLQNFITTEMIKIFLKVSFTWEKNQKLTR